MSDRLQVRLLDRLAGHVEINGDLRSPEDWLFQYDAAYLAGSSTPLSVSLPLRAEPFEGAVVRNWFANLLPEGMVREAITARLRLPDRDDFALLAAIGGECAGAVSVGNGNVAAAEDEPDSDDSLFPRNVEIGEGAWAALAGPRWLSLAGAQDKSAVVLVGDEVRLPRKGELSTHILKPESHRLPGLRDLEAFGLRLARAVNLPVASARLMEVAHQRVLLVERYDRRNRDDGSIERLHQEDFCQALGYPGEHKYESAGGPSLAACAELIRTRLRLGPDAVRGFLDWVVFCALIGNADAHAKNLALLRDRNGRLGLAPFYDLVPTIAFTERMVDRTPALRIGSARRVTTIALEDWIEFSTNTGYSPRFVARRVASMAGSILESLPDVIDQLVIEGATEKRLRDRFAPAVDANVRRLREALVE